MDETEWNCEKCGCLNFIIYDDIMSSYCAGKQTLIELYNLGCSLRNDNIHLII